MKDSRKRSLAKTISWRVFATALTAVVSYAITGSLVIAVSITTLDALSKTAAYYFHERAWERIPLGKTRTGGLN